MTPWSVALQAALSMGFSRQEYWSGLLFPPPGNLPDPGIELNSPALQADSLPSKPPGKIFLLLEVTNKITHTIYFYTYSATIIILDFIHVLYFTSLIILIPHCETCLCFRQTF